MNRSLFQAAVPSHFPARARAPPFLHALCAVGFSAGRSPERALPRPGSPMQLYFCSSLAASTQFCCVYCLCHLHQRLHLLFVVSLPHWNVSSANAQTLSLSLAAVLPVSEQRLARGRLSLLGEDVLIGQKIHKYVLNPCREHQPSLCMASGNIFMQHIWAKNENRKINNISESR